MHPEVSQRRCREMGTTNRTGAPYRPGEAIVLRHENRHGVVVAPCLIDRVVRLNDGRWRVEAFRDDPNFPRVHVVVDATGVDGDGDVIPTHRLAIAS
jgi:hypothetical protein